MRAQAESVVPECEDLMLEAAVTEEVLVSVAFFWTLWVLRRSGDGLRERGKREIRGSAVRGVIGMLYSCVGPVVDCWGLSRDMLPVDFLERCRERIFSFANSESGITGLVVGLDIIAEEVNTGQETEKKDCKETAMPAAGREAEDG